MKKLLTMMFALALSIQTYASDAEAAVVDAPVDPADYLVIDGMDWAWAAPCRAFDPSCGVVDFSFQGPLGWAIATTAQIDAVLASVGGLDAFVDMFEPGDVCASRFFSTVHSHCDYGDGRAGHIYNFSGNASPLAPTLETFAVRIGAVPVPAALPLLLAGFGVLGAMKRRKKA